MGLFSDALRHLFSSDPAERRAGLAGLAGRMFGVEPVKVTHPAIAADVAFDVYHYPKTGARAYALTSTIGLGDTSGRELLALTLADSRDPANDRIAWMLAAAADLAPGMVLALPEGCLGRSSHVVSAEPWPLPPLDRPEYERILGARLELVIPITAREAEFVAAGGVAAFVDAMRAQAIVPYADRPAGETRLP